MEKWQSNLCVGIIALVGLQLASADIDRLFFSEPVKAPEKMGFQQNQVQVVSKNDTIKSESQSELHQAAEKPEPTQVKPTGGSGLTLSTLNAMDAKALEQINGIGPVLAKRIVAYRQEHGNFKTIDGLNAVKGIGPKKLEKIKSQFGKGNE